MSLWESLLSVLFARLNGRTISFTKKIWGMPMNPKYTDFFAKIRPDALKIEGETGIPWIFAATQAAHESGCGESRLTTTANNLFGFTANAEWMNKPSPTVKFLTRECSDKPPEQIRYWEFEGDIFKKDRTPAGGSELQVWRYFRKYDSWEASLRDWAAHLATPRYAAALAGAKAGDFAAFAKGLEAGGYATDKDPKTGQLVYAAKLINLHSQLEGIA